MKIYFVNGNSLPCGCKAEFSNGNGNYSDVISMSLCRKHGKVYKESMKEYDLSASGQYFKIQNVTKES